MATVVAFHAHPDDQALLTGGTLARLRPAVARLGLAGPVTGLGGGNPHCVSCAAGLAGGASSSAGLAGRPAAFSARALARSMSYSLRVTMRWANSPPPDWMLVTRCQPP